MTMAPEWRAVSDNSLTLEDSVALLRFADTVRARLEQSLNGIGLSWARYEILDCLTRSGAMTYSGLARTLVRHRTSVAATVSALEDAGLVVRASNPYKQQQHLIRITTRGHDIRTQAEEMLTAQS